MNRLLPIMKNEFNKIIFSMILILFVILTFGLSQYIILQKNMISQIMFLDNRQFYINSITACIPGFALLSIFIIVYNQFNKDNKEFLFSLPYKKNEIMICRMLCGILTYTIPFIIFTIILSLVYDQYKFSLYNTLWVYGEHNEFIKLTTKAMLFKNIFIQWLVFTSTYFATITIEVIFQDLKESIIVNFLLIMLPSSFINMILQIFNISNTTILGANTIINPFYFFDRWNLKDYNNLAINNIQDTYIIFVILLVAVIFFVSSFIFFKTNTKKLACKITLSAAVLWSLVISFYMLQELNNIVIIFGMIAFATIVFGFVNKLLGVLK